MHTRSRRNYLLRLGGFALVSEIPFDLAFSEKMIDPSSQNVFFTLLIGIFVLTVWEWSGRNVRVLGKRKGRRVSICAWLYFAPYGYVSCPSAVQRHII